MNVSKYAALREAMGQIELYNDRSKKGRILKWEASTMGASKEDRQKTAAELMTKLKNIPQVQKVVISNYEYYRPGEGPIQGFDKIAVYIE